VSWTSRTQSNRTLSFETIESICTTRIQTPHSEAGAEAAGAQAARGRQVGSWSVELDVGSEPGGARGEVGSWSEMSIRWKLVEGRTLILKVSEATTRSRCSCSLRSEMSTSNR
jgi:hypothetical protein